MYLMGVKVMQLTVEVIKKELLEERILEVFILALPINGIRTHGKKFNVLKLL